MLQFGVIFPPLEQKKIPHGCTHNLEFQTSADFHINIISFLCKFQNSLHYQSGEKNPNLPWALLKSVKISDKRSSNERRNTSQLTNHFKLFPNGFIMWEIKWSQCSSVSLSCSNSIHLQKVLIHNPIHLNSSLELDHTDDFFWTSNGLKKLAMFSVDLPFYVPV